MPVGRHLTSIKKHRGKLTMTFIAAMDNSGGSAGGVLDAYGQDWTEEDKMEKIHAFRLRMINSSMFTRQYIDSAILYKDSIERGIVPILKAKDIRAILKVDNGCKEDGTLKDFDVGAMCDYALQNECYGTKMRSIVHGVDTMPAVLDQQFSLAEKIFATGLMPIVEPEIPINSPNKQVLEEQLAKEITSRMHRLKGACILKLTLPEIPNTYATLLDLDKLERLVGLSGGYTTHEACIKLSMNRQMSASFSRALSEGLNYLDSEDYFETAICKNISIIAEASSRG